MTIKGKVRAKTAIRKLTGHISFGDILHSIRWSLELTQVQMAKKLNISKQDLCNIEKNRKTVSVERAISFAKKLDLPVKALVSYVLQDQLHKAGMKCEVYFEDIA